TSDATLFFTCGSTAAQWPLMFDRSNATPRAGNTYLFDDACAGGPFFLYSNFSRAGVRVGQGGLGDSYAIKMASTIGDWASAVPGTPPHGALDAISPNTIGIDAQVSRDGKNGLGTPAFSTTTNSDLLVAFVTF